MKTPVKLNLHMRPTRLIVIVLLMSLIFISVIYWAVRLRSVMTPPTPAVAITAGQSAAPVSATTALFGAQPDTAFVGGSMQVSGVVIAPEPNDSIAILTESGRTNAYRIGTEIMPGIHLAEVHRQYVLVSDGARKMRIEVPQIGSQSSATTADVQPEEPPAGASPSGVGMRGEPPHSPNNAENEGADPAAEPPSQ